MKRIYAYVGNHGKQDGIEEYITLFHSVFGDRGIEVVVSNDLVPDQPNIIIDEFTNCYKNRDLEIFRSRHPSTRLIFVLTEFVRSRWGMESFNHFAGLRASAVLAIFTIFIKKMRRDFPPISLRDWLLALLFLPLLVFEPFSWAGNYLLRSIGLKKFSVKTALNRIQSDYHKLLYFHMRYLGLLANLKHADAIISSHESVVESMEGILSSIDPKPVFLGVAYSEFDEQCVLDKLMVDKQPFMEVTGSITPERQKWMERINAQLRIMGLHHTFDPCQTFSFSRARSRAPCNRGAYSLHPPQTATWPYSSPTRIYRALAVDGNLPVLTKWFGQNPIEDICYIYRDSSSLMDLAHYFDHRDDMRAFVAPRLAAYNLIAKRNNDDMTVRLKRICGFGTE